MNRDLKTATLIEGLDDWVPLVAIDYAAQRLDAALGESRRRELILEVIRQLLEGGLVEVGTVTEKDGYIALREPTSTVLRMVRASFEDGPDKWSYAFWLNNTPTGDAAALQAEASE